VIPIWLASCNHYSCGSPLGFCGSPTMPSGSPA
jgi:hypothetical protein